MSTMYEEYDMYTYLAELGGYLGIFVGLSIYDLICLLGQVARMANF